MFTFRAPYFGYGDKYQSPIMVQSFGENVGTSWFDEEAVTGKIVLSGGTKESNKSKSEAVQLIHVVRWWGVSPALLLNLEKCGVSELGMLCSYASLHSSAVSLGGRVVLSMMITKLAQEKA